MPEYESVRQTKYDTLCFECQSKLDIRRPQFHGLVAFKGDYNSIICDKCDKIIV